MNVHVATLLEPSVKDSGFLSDVLAGLSANPKKLSPKYFYDAAGSELFEEITRLPEYYPTRTELGILGDNAADIASFIPNDAALIEFGAGASTKIRRLLQCADISAYVPVDISGDFLAEQTQALRRDYPSLTVAPVVADFTSVFDLPHAVANLPKVGFFPGSTIGNFEPHEASQFLRRAHDILGRDALFIVGVDLEKDDRVLHAAYNDAAGVTARFNLNLLVRINRELGGNFEIANFRHRAVYNRERHRIEMHLIARRPQSVRIAGRVFNFRMGESIYTESSYKYSIERFGALARGADWSPLTTWTDANSMFSVHALRAI
jgi:dimethylhistidine N-methyltransferase